MLVVRALTRSAIRNQHLAIRYHRAPLPSPSRVLREGEREGGFSGIIDYQQNPSPFQSKIQTPNSKMLVVLRVSSARDRLFAEGSHRPRREKERLQNGECPHADFCSPRLFLLCYAIRSCLIGLFLFIALSFMKSEKKFHLKRSSLSLSTGPRFFTPLLVAASVGIITGFIAVGLNELS